MRRYAHFATSCVLLAMVLPTTGCVFSDIRDQLVEINATTARTSATLANTSESLAKANDTLVHLQEQMEQVYRTNQLLLDLQVGLGTDGMTASPDGTAPARKSIMDTLGSIDASLGKLDLHLASLRRTLENIDSTIPFIGFADPAKDEPALDADGNPIVDPEAPPAAPLAAPPAKPEAPPATPDAPQ